MNPTTRLVQLGITLPAGVRAAGNYAPAVRSGDLLFLSGKAPLAVGGVVPKGRLGGEYSADDGYELARSACISLLATIRDTLGSLDGVVQVLELQGVLNTTPDFEDHARVLDGASDLLVAVLGTAGIHARSVFGAVSLRNQVPLTVRATVRCLADGA